MLASDSINWSQWAVTGLPFLLAGLAWIGREVRRNMGRIAKFETEHRVLMTDLKERTEALENATPGLTPKPESRAVSDARNGA